MKSRFDEVAEGIYRLCIPFDGNIYTTVFALVEKRGSIVVDCGSNEYDAINYIIPAIESLEITPDWFICTHLHGDHCGGLETLIKKYPHADVGGFFNKKFANHKRTQTLENGQELFERFKCFHMSGHSNDGLMVYDKKCEILISGDGLQQFGLTRFGTSISNLRLYKLTIEMVRRLNPKIIIASHDYEPLGYYVEGGEVEKLLLNCEDAIDRIEAFVNENIELTADLIAKCYAEKFPNLPKVPINTFVSIKNKEIVL